MSGTLYEHLSRYYFCWRHDSPSSTVARHSIFFCLLTVTCSSKTHSKYIAGFPLEKCLSEHPTMLHCSTFLTLFLLAFIKKSVKSGRERVKISPTHDCLPAPPLCLHLWIPIVNFILTSVYEFLCSNYAVGFIAIHWLWYLLQNLFCFNKVNDK